MLDGKMLRGETGTPMRRIARANNSLAEADPEPLTLANLMTQSFMASTRLVMDDPLHRCFTRDFHVAALNIEALRADSPGHIPGNRGPCSRAHAALNAL